MNMTKYKAIKKMIKIISKCHTVYVNEMSRCHMVINCQFEFAKQMIC